MIVATNKCPRRSTSTPTKSTSISTTSRSQAMRTCRWSHLVGRFRTKMKIVWATSCTRSSKWIVKGRWAKPQHWSCNLAPSTNSAKSMTSWSESIMAQVWWPWQDAYLALRTVASCRTVRIRLRLRWRWCRRIAFRRTTRPSSSTDTSFSLSCMWRKTRTLGRYSRETTTRRWWWCSARNSKTRNTIVLKRDLFANQATQGTSHSKNQAQMVAIGIS